jgi:prophage regulatory protein
MGWQNFTIFLPEGDEVSPFLYNSATGETTPNPAWRQPEPAGAEEHNMLRIGEVMRRTGLSRTTLHRMEREKRFPKRQKIGKRAIAWRESEVRAFLARA